MALYGDRDALARVLGGLRMPKRSLTYNLVKSVLDTAQAEVASMTPRPKLLTTRGDWGLQRRAEALEQMLEGEYELNDVYEKGARGFLDAGKIGYFALKVHGEGGRPKVELMSPGELIVDPVDGQFQSPRCMYRLVPMDRAVARATFGGGDNKIGRAIDAAPSADRRTWFPWLPDDDGLDQIFVLEAWRTPDPSDWKAPKKGAHAIAVHGATVAMEEWAREHPILVWRYEEESTGYWGRGCVENLRPLQVDLNDSLQKIQDCFRLSSGFTWLIDGNGRVKSSEMTNEPGTLLRYWGSKPEMFVSNNVPEQLLNHARETIQRGYEQEGVSSMSAQAKKPAGLDSGAAIREFNDTGSQRFIIKSKSYERAIGVRLAKLIIAEKQAIAERGEEVKPTKVNWRRGRGVSVKNIEWKDASLEEDQYGIRVFPSSSLPSQPSGRIATVEQWIATGFLSREQGMQLLDFPDLEQFASLELSAHEMILNACETMIEDGEYVPPEPVQNLELSIKLTISAYQRYRIDGAPEERTELLLRYIDDVRAMLDEAAAGQQMAAPQPDVAAQAAQAMTQPGAMLS